MIALLRGDWTVSRQPRKQLLDALITNANTKGPTILGQGVAPATMTQSVGALARAAGGLEIPTPVARVTPPPVNEITPRPGRPDPVLLRLFFL